MSWDSKTSIAWRIGHTPDGLLSFRLFCCLCGESDPVPITMARITAATYFGEPIRCELCGRWSTFVKPTPRLERGAP